MKIEIAGFIEVVKRDPWDPDGDAFVRMLIGAKKTRPLFKRHRPPPSPRMMMIPLATTDRPVGGWKSAINSKLPYRMASMSLPDNTYWLCSDKLIRMTECAHLTE